MIQGDRDSGDGIGVDKKNNKSRVASTSTEEINNNANQYDTALKIGSSISDLGQHLFHQVDRVSAKLVGDAVDGFFSEEAAAGPSRSRSGRNSSNNLPPPSPFMRVATECSTSSDELGSDDDSQQTLQVDNTAKNMRNLRIARMRAKKRTMEKEAGRESNSSLSPPQPVARYKNRNRHHGSSKVDVSGGGKMKKEHRAHKNKNKSKAAAAAAAAAATTSTSSSKGLPRIPELRNTKTPLVDGANSDGDDGDSSTEPPSLARANSRSSKDSKEVVSQKSQNPPPQQGAPSDSGESGDDEIETSYLAAASASGKEMEGTEASNSAITIVHSISNSIRGLATSVLSVQMNSSIASMPPPETEPGGKQKDPPGIRSASHPADDDSLLLVNAQPDGTDNKSGVEDDASQGSRQGYFTNTTDGKGQKKKCRLSKLTIAAILLLVCILVVTLAAVLRPDRSNLRGGIAVSSSSSSTTTGTTTTTADDKEAEAMDDVTPGIRTTDSPTTMKPTDSPTKSPTVWTSTGLPALVYKGTLGPHELCHGDCDDDNDCLPGLVCHRRNGYEHIPGCDTMPGKKGVDYCVLPGGTQYPTAAPVPTASPTRLPTSKPTRLPTKQPTRLVVEDEDGGSSKEVIDSDTKDNGFSFYVMSNGPYDSDEEKIFKAQLKEKNGDIFSAENQDAMFSIHLGDIFSAREQDCDESAYEQAADLLRQSLLPMFVLPGDEDWMDCENTKPKKAFKLWDKTFVGFEQNWKNTNEIPALVERSSDREENFSFLFNDVLFIGINNGGEETRARDVDEDEYKQREKDVHTWVKDQVKTYEDGPLRAVVVFAHAYRFEDTFEWLSERLEDKGAQTILFHGDGGTFNLNKPLSDNFYEVALDRIGRAPPIKVTMLNKPPTIAAKEKIYLGDAVLIDRRGGAY